MWVGNLQKISNIFISGPTQGLTSPLLIKKAPIGSNAGWGLFLWLSTGLRTGSRMAEQPFLLTIARLGHSTRPGCQSIQEPPQPAKSTVPQSGYTNKKLNMKLDEKRR